MKSKYAWGRFSVLPAVLAGLLLAGCATAPPSNVKGVGCQIKKIQWEVAPQAEITAFDCAMGRHAGEDSLIFTVGVKNLNSDPARFRVTILIPEMDKGVAYLVPTGGKPPVLASGADATVKIPFMKVDRMPDKIEVTAKMVQVE